MSRNLVLCCDGTSNQFSQDRTSVIKLYHTLDKDPSRQATYYHPGIGTRAPSGVGTPVGSLVGRIAGLAFGYRLQDDVVDAYRFLMNTYQPGDAIYIFGFSRGAYTARVIAAMLHMYGLAAPGNDALVPYAVDMLWAISRKKKQGQRDACFALAADFRATMSGGACPVHFLGVWDTVNSVGWIGSPLSLPFTRDNPSISIVRHAKALDEIRGFFRVNWFTSVPGRNTREVWFPGSHCDIGGGYPEADSGMSKYPLAWMAEEARSAGLLIDGQRLAEVLGMAGGNYAEASPDASLHQSMTPPWMPLEFVPKKHWNYVQKKWEWRANLFHRRTLPDVPIVHDVAWKIPGYTVPPRSVRLSMAPWPS